jgi:hypothetical protein
MRTCVTPDGTFCYGIHSPSYTVRMLRRRSRIEALGRCEDGNDVLNTANYPGGDIAVPEADRIYEIANALPFRGTTYIGKAWADRSAADPERIRIPPPPPVSLTALLAEHGRQSTLIESLPRPLKLALATTSTDPDDLVRLAHCSCSFTADDDGRPTGLRYRCDAHPTRRPIIGDHDLFEAVANNPALPDDYKIAMVIRPGAQGGSEIVGDHHDGDTHIYEYLRRNSYIGGGHYAANMAEDAIRYRISDLGPADISGLRHLYYQRSYVRLGQLLGLDIGSGALSADELEAVRLAILARLDAARLDLTATLWGWNFGFDFAPSGYRLHASHQQVHQQFAMIPRRIDAFDRGCSEPSGEMRPFGCGDMIGEVVAQYRSRHGREFFPDLLRAIPANHRMDERRDREAELVIWQDERVMLFVPKAQTSQWELQIMTRPGPDGNWPGNILETDQATRASLDTALLAGQRALAGRGARLVTTIEYPKPFDSAETAQPLLYSLLPKLPQSPGAFSEAQLRFINGHYPEDFAAVCRRSLATGERQPETGGPRDAAR